MCTMVLYDAVVVGGGVVGAAVARLDFLLLRSIAPLLTTLSV